MPDSHRPRILIVEDSRSVAEKYERALQRIGECRIVERFDQVLYQIMDFDPQVILLDIILEGERVYDRQKAGVRILEKVRELRAPFGLIPVIVITGTDDEDIKERCRELGVLDFLRKPAALEAIRGAVENALREQVKRACVRVFISSAEGDLEAERIVAKQAVADLGPKYNPVTVEDLASRPLPPNELCRQAVRESDLLVILLGSGYGAPVGRGDCSSIEEQFNTARDEGKPTLVFVKRGVEREPGLRAFLTQLQDPNTGHLVREFADDLQLRIAVQGAIAQINIVIGLSVTAEETGAEKEGGVSDQVPEVVKILFLAANPTDTARLRLDEEHRAVDQALRRSEYRDRFDLNLHGAVRTSDVQELLLRYRPDIVHFSGHGSAEEGIILQNSIGRSQVMSAPALGNLFRVLKGNVRCVVLNACYSEQQAQAIAEHIDCVVGMTRAIKDTLAARFAEAFYRALAFGEDVATAFELGRLEVDPDNLAEYETPKLLALNKDPTQVVFVLEESQRR